MRIEPPEAFSIPRSAILSLRGRTKGKLILHPDANLQIQITLTTILPADRAHKRRMTRGVSNLGLQRIQKKKLTLSFFRSYGSSVGTNIWIYIKIIAGEGGITSCGFIKHFQLYSWSQIAKCQIVKITL